MKIKSHGADEASSGLCGGLIYHNSFVSIIQTEQSLNSSRVQVLSLILLKRALNEAGLKLVFHSRNWPVPRTLRIGTGGGLVSLSALTVQLISELLLAFQSENRSKIKHGKNVATCFKKCLANVSLEPVCVYSPSIIKIALMRLFFFSVSLYLKSQISFKLLYSVAETSFHNAQGNE